jgi:hypothetical protein
MVNDEYADVTFALFALKAKGEPQRLLVREAETLRQRLLHVPGVKKVNIIGEQSERIYIEFSHDRLATLGVSPQEVFAALNNQNALTPAGSVETKGPQVFIRLDGAFDELQKSATRRSWRRAAPEAVGHRHRQARLRRPGDPDDPQRRRARPAAGRRHARRLERARPGQGAGPGSRRDQYRPAAGHEPDQGHRPGRQHQLGGR